VQPGDRWLPAGGPAAAEGTSAASGAAAGARRYRRSAAIPGGTTATTTAEEWSYGDQWRSVTYSQGGHPVYDEGFSRSSAYTLVSYLTRTWARQPGLGRPAVLSGPVAPGALAAPNRPLPVPHGCEPVIAALPLLLQPGLPGIGFSASSPPATVARALHSEVSCGTLAVAGRQRVDGIEAIELTSRQSRPISETIWVNPGTYLPVRIVLRSAPGTPVLQRTADITWLQPTMQNLARLTVPIPAGFRQVPLAKVVLPILQQIPDGSLKAQALCPPLIGLRAGTKPLFPAPTGSPRTIPRLTFSPPARMRILLGLGDVC